MIVSRVYERSSTNGCVQGFEFSFRDANRINALSNAAHDGYYNEIQLFFIRHACSKGVLRTQTFNNRSSVPIAIGNKCGNYRPSFRRNFHSSRRSGRIYSILFIVFKRHSWSRRTASAWNFFPIEKGKAPAAISGMK